MFRITASPIDLLACRNGVLSPRAGGYASFEGWVRNHNEGNAVISLAYEAYEPLARSEGGRILAEAHEKFDIQLVYAVHRVGNLEIGDVAVWVGASAAHRDAAFAACRYVIDEIKYRVPIWKREVYADGRVEWVNCNRCGAHAHAGHDR